MGIISALGSPCKSNVLLWLATGLTAVGEVEFTGGIPVLRDVQNPLTDMNNPESLSVTI